MYCLMYHLAGADCGRSCNVPCPTPCRPPCAAACHRLAGSTSITGAIQAAQRLPAGSCLVLLAAQMLGLAQGQHYFQQLAVSGQSIQGVPGALHCRAGKLCGVQGSMQQSVQQGCPLSLHV